uniref:Adhesion G protein-coupled receptor G3 n=1 Tax=Hucho hucho TaxID=62062 RepID=A0A4W5JP74_9TELE
MMKTSYLILIFICIPATLRTNDNIPNCKDALQDCLFQEVVWTRCFEDRITRCIPKTRMPIPNFYRWSVNSSNKAEESTDSGHRVHIPAHALQRSKRNDSHSTDYVHITMAVLNSSLFKLGPVQGSRSGEVLGQSVLAVRVGDHSVSDLDQPVRIAFRNTNVTQRGTCVFWKDSEKRKGEGDWSSEGCITTLLHGEFVCSCNHLSFFAVLVNSKLSVDPVNAANLGYISYIGSSFSVVFTTVTLVMYICLRKGQSEQSLGIHVQLTGALLFLHLSYLLSEWWVWHEADGAEGRVCLAFGLILHWALLSTFTWLAIEGFHLYMLLVRVFNIYVKKYLLKLSLVGWGEITSFTHKYLFFL